MFRRGEKVVLSAGAELRVGAMGAVVSGGAEWGVCCRGVVVFRWGEKGGGWDSRCIRGDQSGPSWKLWTSGWIWIWIGGWD